MPEIKRCKFEGEWRFCDGLHSMPGELCKTCSKAAAQNNHPYLK